MAVRVYSKEPTWKVRPPNGMILCILRAQDWHPEYTSLEPMFVGGVEAAIFLHPLIVWSDFGALCLCDGIHSVVRSYSIGGLADRFGLLAQSVNLM